MPAARLTMLADLITSGAGPGRSPEDVYPVIERVAMVLLALLDVDTVSVSRIEPEAGLIRTLFSGRRPGNQQHPRPLTEVYAVDAYPRLVRLVRTGRPWRALAGDDPDGESSTLRELGRGAAAAAAIPVEGRVWGELYVTRGRARGLTAVDVGLLEVVAAHIGALVAAQARADERSAKSEVDNLTGLSLRAAAERAVLGHWAGVAVAVLDVDGLKAVNDTYGHAAGDRLLQSVARSLEGVRQHRADATISRMGGDEFVVVMPGLDVEAWLPHLQRAMDEVAALPLGGLSCGVATSDHLHGDLGSGRPLFRLADAALYRAKRTAAPSPVLSRRPRTGRRRPLGPMSARGANDLSPDDVARAFRLRQVVDGFGRSVNAAAWWISVVEPGSDQFVIQDRMIARDCVEEDGRDIGLVGDGFPMADYAWSRRVLGGGHFWVGLHDVDADPAEQAVVAEAGYIGNLVTGLTTADGVGWLVEVFSDPATAAIESLGPQMLDLLVTASGSARPTSALPGGGP